MQLEDKQNEIIIRQEKRLEADIKKVLSTPSGRRFFWRLWTECGIFRTSFSDSNQMAFNEGKRIIGLWSYNLAANVDLDMVNRMQRESISEQIQIKQEMEKCQPKE